MDNGTATAYLDRIGATAPAAPDAAGLAVLQERHLRSVPFENLSIHLGEPIVLAEDALVEKVVGRRRGGFCYELNGAFGALLRHLGYDVSLLAARVHGGGALGPPYDHLALRVDLPEGPWITDVGFGRFAARPFRLDVRDDQPDPAGTVRVVDAGHGDVDALLAGEPQYRLDLRPRELDEFVATCWYHRTSPDSPFTQAVTCSLPTPTGRVTVTDRTLITTEDGRRNEREISTGDELLACYRDLFGIVLDRVPVLSGPRPEVRRPAQAAVASPGD
ncbi:arylamine N-acetyltransferase [Nocardioides guangzhouensis]|uniref:Arylamine N-acetyltransferase n=1 Tax=Nocardioides guangzhouensis TaxID=2497878 RepID=A0A4Q4ZMP3_9ACTN|nr:arylamine N-acetyltransferase [Nocardioides guangzhouensis]RYP88891.1 arylamine N-acetyltransferase [Nocardioides guangzhouensis]